MSTATENLLSYLTGLGPVGTPIEFKLADVCSDMGYRSKWSFYNPLNKLLRKGFVRRLACGAQGSTGLLVVLRRLEAA